MSRTLNLPSARPLTTAFGPGSLTGACFWLRQLVRSRKSCGNCRIAGPARGRHLCPIDLHKSSPYSRTRPERPDPSPIRSRTGPTDTSNGRAQSWCSADGSQRRPNSGNRTQDRDQTRCFTHPEVQDAGWEWYSLRASTQDLCRDSLGGAARSGPIQLPATDFLRSELNGSNLPWKGHSRPPARPSHPLLIAQNLVLDVAWLIREREHGQPRQPVAVFLFGEPTRPPNSPATSSARGCGARHTGSSFTKRQIAAIPQPGPTST